MAKIIVDGKLCKGCSICVEFCPLKVYEMSEEIDERGYHHAVPVNADNCRECGLCLLLCPDYAITIFEGK